MNPRTPVEELKLQGSPNLKRALSYKDRPAVAKREELEAIFRDLKARREDALAQIRADGLVITVEKFNRERLYHARVQHPALKIAQACERQMVALAKALTAEDGPGKKSAADMLAGLDEALRAN